MKKFSNLWRRFSIGFIFLAVLFLLLATPLPVLAQDTIKIGKLEPMSGFMTRWGQLSQAAWSIILEEQNAKGGLLGKKIEVIFEDNEYKPDVATRKAKKLVLEDKVDFLGSGVGSHISIAMNQFSKSTKKIYLNFGGITDSIQGKDFSPYSFRMCNNVYQVVSALVQYAATKPFRKFYLISPDYVFGREFHEGIKEQLKKYIPDAQVVGEDFHPLGTKEFGPYVTKIMASGADAIISGTFSTDAYLLVKTAREMGLKAPFPFFTYAMADATLSKQLGDQMVGVSSVTMSSVTVDTPENKRLLAKWNGKYKDKAYDWWWPSGNWYWELMGWPMFFAAVEKAGSLDPEKIIQAFEGFKYKTAMGEWTMRACDHQMLAPMFAIEIEAGPNPYYPWAFTKKHYEVPAEKTALPATADYNPRCK